MKVLYVSHASRVVAHRDKLSALASRVRLHAVMPRDWGADGCEPPDSRHPAIEVLPAAFHGHIHFHLYGGLGRRIDAFEPDLVHMDEEPYSMVTLQASVLCRSRGIPFVFFAWQNLQKRLPPPFGALRKAVFRRAGGGIAGSETAAQVLRRGGFEGPLAVIPQMGVDPARFRPDPDARARSRRALGVEDDAFVAGFVGRLVPEKGVDLLLDAARLVPSMHLAVVGGGPEEGNLREGARKRGVDGRVHFVGPVASTEVPTWMVAFDALVLPTRDGVGWTEQFGRVLIEAMACGVPVVGSSAGEIPVVIGDAGLVVPQDDTRALADALGRLASSPGERARLATAGMARVRAHFTQEKVAEDTVAFYRSVRAGSPGERSPSGEPFLPGRR